MNEIKFLGFSFGLQVLLIAFVVVIGGGMVWLMDKLWPTRPHYIKDWESFVAMCSIPIAVIIIVRTT